MNRSTHCVAFQDEGVPGLYVAGHLAEAKEEAFEEHLLTCRICQDEVSLGLALREELGEPGRAGMDRTKWLVAAAAVVLITGATLLTLPYVQRRQAISELGQVAVAPVYLGVPVRSTEFGDSLFAAGMEAYVSSDYEGAAELLREAAQSSEQTGDPIRFFLAASLLMTDRPREAAEFFETLAAEPDSPYAPEAAFYGAKARLSLGEPETALEVLQRASEGSAPISRDARLLEERIQEVLQR